MINFNVRAYSKVMCIILIMILMSSCTAGLDSKNEESEKLPQITLTPVELFKGEGKKFKHFLGSMSGAFKLSYKGNKPNVDLDIDIWKDGRKEDSVGSIGDLFFSPEGVENKEIEVVISIETISLDGQDEFNRIKVSTIHEEGSTHVVFTAPLDKKLTARGLIATYKQTFTADGTVPVWGMQATSTNSIRTADITQESLSKTEWALVFTLRFED